VNLPGDRGEDLTGSSLPGNDSTGRVDGASREGEEWLRPVVEHASDAISLLRADWTVSYVSSAIEQVLGYRPEERGRERLRAGASRRLGEGGESAPRVPAGSGFSRTY
jgi:PAS domain-containing protein